MSEQLPRSMTAIHITEPGDASVLAAASAAIPAPRDRDVLIEVSAAGVNRPDVLQRQGLYPVPPDASPYPGLEVCGIVRASGSAASRWRVGDRVMALVHGGGYAQFCTVHEDHCLEAPPPLNDIEAAAIPETFFTVWYNVFMRGALEAGETILVHGGSSGIGTTAIQLANAFGARVIVTAGSDDKCAFCEDLGAHRAINYRDADWFAVAKDICDGNGPDVILDMVAGDYMQKNIDLLARDGRYVIIAFLRGPSAELNMRPVLGKRLTITGSTLRPQSDTEKAAIAAQLTDKVLPLLVNGTIRPIIDSVFPLADAAAAHERIESSVHMGKIVLAVDDRVNA